MYERLILEAEDQWQQEIGTLTHKLALPAQLRNNFWCSCFEKNLSSTVKIRLRLCRQGSSDELTICTSRTELHCVLHLSRKERSHSSRPVEPR